jgi:hypothetical protein
MRVTSVVISSALRFSDSLAQEKALSSSSVAVSIPMYTRSSLVFDALLSSLQSALEVYQGRGRLLSQMHWEVSRRQLTKGFCLS